jgi:hypothetical protein
MDGFRRTGIHAIGIFALIADDRYMVEIFIFVLNQKTGPSGIIPLDQVHAAGQLTDAASCTFVKMSVDKGFDDFLLNRLFILKIENITYYVLCK